MWYNIATLSLIIVIGMIVLLMLSVQFVDMGYCAVASDMEKANAVQISGIALSLCFVQILLRAIDIPFLYRFGSKKGSFIKMICLVTVAIILLAFLILNTERFDTIIESFSDALTMCGGRMIQLTLFGVFLMWLTKKTGSVFPAVIGHYTFNERQGALADLLYQGNIPENADLGVIADVFEYLPMIAVAAVFMIMLFHEKAEPPKLHNGNNAL